MAKVTYKGEERELKIDNRCLMNFEMAGGNLKDFESKPFSTTIILTCCALGLDNDFPEHANHLPSLEQLTESLKQAMQESGIAGDLGNGNGSIQSGEQG